MVSLTDIVQNTSVASDTVVLFWLEQNHFIIKTPAGKITHLDPFISRTMKPEIFVYPEALIEPGDAKADYVFLTHDHRDHADPDTIGPMAAANPECDFIGTPEACARASTAGVDPKRLIEVVAGDERELDDFRIRATFSEYTSESDKTPHIGFVWYFGDLTIYNVGDTRKQPETYIDRMGDVAGLRPDLMIVPINDGYNNPGPDGATRLVEHVDPRLIVPCHFDCFKHNTIDPQRFIEALPVERRDSVRIMSRGDSLVVAPR